MDSGSTRAVFMSYAREDGTAAVRIAEALRSHGVEVWFDKDELRGGDAWDAKIRGQIRACALFVPVISANTNARLEGYFRREWKQAVERTHDMDDDLPFLVPVVIDGTADADARVPEKFRAVQWTRLPGGEVPPTFAERIRLLLGRGPGKPAGAPPPAAPVRVASKRRSLSVALGFTGLAAAVALALLRPWARIPTAAPVVPRTGDASEAGQSSIANFSSDPDLKRAMRLVNDTEAIPEDYSLAEDITKGVLNQRPTDPEAVTVMAYIQDAFLYRGFDRSAERLSNAQRYAERAVRLAPDNAYAQGALGVYVFQQGGGAELVRAQQVLNRAIALNPKEPFFYRFRDDALFADPSVTSVSAIASAERTIALFPSDALSHYELSRHYRDVGRIEDMERELDRTLAIEPIVNAIVWKARVALWVRGDPEEMKTILDRVPSRGRSLERAAMGSWIYSMATGKVKEGLDALANLPETWVADYDYVGPKAILEGSLLDLQGQRDLANLRYAAALAEVKRREAAEPGDSWLIRDEVWALHGMGRDSEARSLLRIVNEGVERPFRMGFGNSWWPPFSAYDVVIQNYNDINGGPPWPAAVRADFENFVRGGGGVYIFHSGQNAFDDWPAYNEIIGLGWRKKDYGSAIAISDSGERVVYPPGAGRNTSHAPNGDVVVHLLGRHPIHEGLPAAWKTPHLEVYYDARGPAKNVEILSYARDPRFGENWPVEWTVAYGKGRAYIATFGHVWRGDVQPESMRCAGVQTMIVRALQWLAVRPVTFPVPADFPTADQKSIRPPIALPGPVSSL
jgi:tetratricopeptide (TPR) repeat protein